MENIWGEDDGKAEGAAEGAASGAAAGGSGAAGTDAHPGRVLGVAIHSSSTSLHVHGAIVSRMTTSFALRVVDFSHCCQPPHSDSPWQVCDTLRVLVCDFSHPLPHQIRGAPLQVHVCHADWCQHLHCVASVRACYAAGHHQRCDGISAAWKAVGMVNLKLSQHEVLHLAPVSCRLNSGLTPVLASGASAKPSHPPRACPLSLYVLVR